MGTLASMYARRMIPRNLQRQNNSHLADTNLEASSANPAPSRGYAGVLLDDPDTCMLAASLTARAARSYRPVVDSQLRDSWAMVDWRNH
jgi:hypothetical protein